MVLGSGLWFLGLVFDLVGPIVGFCCSCLFLVSRFLFVDQVICFWNLVFGVGGHFLCSWRTRSTNKKRLTKNPPNQTLNPKTTDLTPTP
jgi:hypothetical protein